MDGLLTKTGELPPGFHEGTLKALRPILAYNEHRREMWHKMISFLGWPILSHKFSHLYLGGGFASHEESPRDIDLVLQTRDSFGPASFKVIEPFFAVGLDTIRDVFAVHLHFWMENAPPGMIDFRAYFQHGRPTQAHLPHRFPAKGLLCISLTTPDIGDRLRDELEAAVRPGGKKPSLRA